MILFHSDFKKAYRKRAQKIRELFDARLALFEKDPYNPSLNNHVLHGRWLGYRSINVTGDFRAVFKQQGDTFMFVDIDTHSNLYR